MDERRADWQHGVDENLASLNAGQRVWERDVGNLRKTLADVDHLLRGDTERGTSGLIARLEALERDMAKINAILFMDATGKKGLLHEVDVLYRKEKRWGKRWEFFTAVAVAILSLIGMLLTNWNHVEGFVDRIWKPPAAVKVAPKAKRAKAKPRRPAAPPVIPATPDPDPQDPAIP